MAVAQARAESQGFGFPEQAGKYTNTAECNAAKVEFCGKVEPAKMIWVTGCELRVKR